MFQELFEALFHRVQNVSVPTHMANKKTSKKSVKRKVVKKILKHKGGRSPSKHDKSAKVLKLIKLAKMKARLKKKGKKR